MRFHAPYMEWAKKRPHPTFDLAGSNVLACTLDDLAGARDALALDGSNDTGYQPLVDAIAARYGVHPDQVATASGAAGANFQVFAALLQPGDDVLIERPGYDPLIGTARLLGARVIRFDRRFEDGYALDPDAVRRALTSRTRVIVITSPHNPTGALADRAALEAVGEFARSAGAHVVVDEVYLDAADAHCPPAIRLAAATDSPFISTSSLTKSYGLSSLRCGWSLSSAEVAERIRRTRDVIDGSGSIVTERLATLAFSQLDRLHARATTLLATNRGLVVDFLRARPEIEVVLSAHSTVLFPRLRGAHDTADFAARLLADHATAVVPGHFFDAPAHIRLGFGGATDVVRGGLERLGGALGRAVATDVHG
jgi:aspartate/methionine/tyrosine aminotransferase